MNRFFFEYNLNEKIFFSIIMEILNLLIINEISAVLYYYNSIIIILILVLLVK